MLCCWPVPNHSDLRNQLAARLQPSHSPPCEQPGSHQSEPTVYRPEQYPTSREFVSELVQVNNRNQQQYDGSPTSAEPFRMLKMVAQSSKPAHACNLQDQTENQAAD
jgi:hypothetical protein